MSIGFNNHNRVQLLGNITRDIELRTIPSGTRVCDFSIAVNERVKKGDEWKNETNYFDCTAWGSDAENLAKFTSKGKAIFVEGKLKQERWVDKSNGQNRSKVKVTVDRIVFIGREKSDDNAERASKPEQKEMQYETEMPEEGEKAPF